MTASPYGETFDVAAIYGPCRGSAFGSHCLRQARQPAADSGRDRSSGRRPERSISGHGKQLARADSQFIYFPSCISRQMGKPGNNGQRSLVETLLTLADRAGIALMIPPGVEGNCCGMPFASKGYTEAYRMTLHRTLERFWEWSGGGRHPIVIDTTSCTHTLCTCGDDLESQPRPSCRRATRARIFARATARWSAPGRSCRRRADRRSRGSAP